MQYFAASLAGCQNEQAKVGSSPKVVGFSL